MIRIFWVAHLSYHFTWVPPFVQIWLNLQNDQLEFTQQMSLSSLQTRDKSIQLLLNSNARVRSIYIFHIQHPKVNIFSCTDPTTVTVKSIQTPDIHISIYLYITNPSTHPQYIHPYMNPSIYRNLRKMLSMCLSVCLSVTKNLCIANMHRSPQTLSIVDILLARRRSKLPSVVYSCKYYLMLPPFFPPHYINPEKMI